MDPFEARRSRLFGLAYRMLGSRADAEDIVQEVYLRWHEADQASDRESGGVARHRRRRGWRSIGCGG